MYYDMIKCTSKKVLHGQCIEIYFLGYNFEFNSYAVTIKDILGYH